MNIIGAHFKHSDDSGFWAMENPFFALLDRKLAEGVSPTEAVKYIFRSCPGPYYELMAEMILWYRDQAKPGVAA